MNGHEDVDEENHQEVNENQIEENHPIINAPTLPTSQTAAHSQSSFANNFQHDKMQSTCILNLIGFSYILMGLNIVLFGLFLFLKIDQDLNWTYSLTCLPLYILLACIGICLHGVISHPSLNYQDLGKQLTLGTLDSNLILFSIFTLLITLKLDDLIRWDFTVIFIPLYIASAVTLFYICFIFPGLIDKEMKLYNEAFLLLLYFFGILVWIIMLQLKLDRFIHWYNFKVFLVLFIVLGTHILINIKNLFETENFMRSVQNFIFVVLLTFCFVIMVLKMDGMIDRSWSACCSPLFLLILLIYGVEFKTIFEKFRN